MRKNIKPLSKDELRNLLEYAGHIEIKPKRDEFSLKLIHLAFIQTPVGTMITGAVEEGICLLEYADRKLLKKEFRTLAGLYRGRIIQGKNHFFELLNKELIEYFESGRKAFTVPIAAPGTTFQEKVWKELLKIPYGQTRSYKQQAIALSNPGAIRAVAHANGTNRIAILIPCHRVIGDQGELTGYGGGLWRKKYLLELESNNYRLNL